MKMFYRRYHSSYLVILSFGILIGTLTTVTLNVYYGAATLSSINCKEFYNKEVSEGPVVLEEISSSPSLHTFQSDSEQGYLQKKLSMIAAVLPSIDSDPELITATYDTWGHHMADYSVFVGANSSHHSSGNISVINIPHFHLKRLYTVSDIYQILTYLHGYRSQYNWLFITWSAIYVNINTMYNLIMKLDPQKPFYFGHSSSQEGTKSYCDKNSGILLSRGLLQALVPRLKDCDSQLKNYAWDLEIGECIQKVAGVTCSKDYSKYFVLDYEGKSDSPDELWSKDSIFTSAISIYPINNMAHMYLIHHYYMSQLVDIHKKHIDNLNSIISSTCLELSYIVLEHKAVQQHCFDIHPETTTNDVGKNNYKPRRIHDIQKWQYFDANHLYSDDTIEPHITIRQFKYHAFEIMSAMKEALKVISKKYKKRFKFKSIQNGYILHNPLEGHEYIIDATYVPVSNGEKYITERVRLLRHLGEQYDVKPSKSDNSEEVNVIVPVSDVTDRCFEFLSMYENAVLMKHHNVHLILVAYGQDVDKIVEKVKLLDNNYSHAKITIINGDGEFSRAKGLDQGMKFLDENKLAFLCDVDMKIDSGFFTRCRCNTIKGKSVYLPEVFKMYNPKFFTKNESETITQSHGHWGSYGYGMLCIYKSDYDEVGGLDTELMGWGNEDIDLLKKIIIKCLDIIRAPDPGLIHTWHTKHCSGATAQTCLSSRSEVLGSKRNLATFLYNLFEKYPNLEP